MKFRIDRIFVFVKKKNNEILENYVFLDDPMSREVLIDYLQAHIMFGANHDMIRQCLEQNDLIYLNELLEKNRSKYELRAYWLNSELQSYLEVEQIDF